MASSLVVEPASPTEELGRVDIDRYVTQVQRSDPESEPPGAPLDVDVLSIYIRAHDGPMDGAPRPSPQLHSIAASDRMQHIWVTYPCSLRVTLRR